MATQDAFKNEMSEENLVDAGLAAIFGWTDIEQTDFGAVVGKSPETCCTENIPRPSKNIASFHTLLKRAVKERKLNIRLAWDDDVYVATDTEQSLLKAGASAIHAVLSMYDDVPAAQNTEHTENGEEL